MLKLELAPNFRKGKDGGEEPCLGSHPLSSIRMASSDQKFLENMRPVSSYCAHSDLLADAWSRRRRPSWGPFPSMSAEPGSEAGLGDAGSPKDHQTT